MILVQPYMKNMNFKVHKKLSNTDFVMENTFWIGVYPGLNEDQLSYTVEKINKFFNN